MDHYLVQLTSRALEDLDLIYYHISELKKAPEAAGALYDKLLDSAETLEIMPERIKLMSPEYAKSKELRMMIIDNYVIIFSIRGSTVYVVRVLHGASDLESKI